MIGSTLYKVFRKDGLENKTVIETSDGFYEVRSNGFLKIDGIIQSEFNLNENYAMLQINEVKTDYESTIINLGNKWLLTHQVDSATLYFDDYNDAMSDPEFSKFYHEELGDFST